MAHKGRNQQAGGALRDRTLHRQGFGSFSASSVVSEGEAIAFSYPSGYCYIVSLQCMLSWFSESQHSAVSKAISVLPIGSRSISIPFGIQG